MFLEWAKSRIEHILYDRQVELSISESISQLAVTFLEMSELLKHVENEDTADDEFLACFQLLRGELNDDEAVNGDERFMEEILLIILQALQHFETFLVSEHLKSAINQVANLSKRVTNVASNEHRVAPVPSAREPKSRAEPNVVTFSSSDSTSLDLDFKGPNPYHICSEIPLDSSNSDLESSDKWQYDNVPYSDATSKLSSDCYNLAKGCSSFGGEVEIASSSDSDDSVAPRISLSDRIWFYVKELGHKVATIRLFSFDISRDQIGSLLWNVLFNDVTDLVMTSSMLIVFFIVIFNFTVSTAY